MPHLSKVYSAEIDGLLARLVEVETDLHAGLHAFTIVGLADKALNEAKERVSSALKNTGVRPPNKENRKIVVNLAPADLKKNGSHYDLSIALGYLLATDQIKNIDLFDALIVGEVSFDGSLRPVDGALSIAKTTKASGKSTLFLPKKNAREAALISGIEVYGVDSLKDLIDHLEGVKKIIPTPPTLLENTEEYSNDALTIDDIIGQESGKRALMIAASGNHNLLLKGSPGSGKTMLASALLDLLPSPSLEELIEILEIKSLLGELKDGDLTALRPFRAPHHSASMAAIVGGGTTPKPGEITGAHRGILFLDELPEFDRRVLEALREPLESREIRVARAGGTAHFPADFLFVAAMNPCPCGYFGDDEKPCVCPPYAVSRYMKKISGPLLDRLDLKLDVQRVKIRDLVKEKNNSEKNLPKIRAQIKNARARQNLRYASDKKTNSNISPTELDSLSPLGRQEKNLLEKLAEKSHLSARAFYKLKKIARTIADLEDSDIIKSDHLLEAFTYRLKSTE
ncbi:MAG: YifB family Mg chelatase-like AAA ATPase [Candidatus Harrisonbacteria bacterium]|nr:YifB family Mg chelatase-like AAA ATPase [Candidatus Harrisonbacteria bacterium]